MGDLSRWDFAVVVVTGLRHPIPSFGLLRRGVGPDGGVRAVLWRCGRVKWVRGAAGASAEAHKGA